VLIAFTGLLFWPAVEGVFQGQPRYFEWDVPEQYWPDLVYLCDALHDGELPLWNPYDRGGYPYYADPQAGAYHPLNWAICATGRNPALGWATGRVIFAFLLSGVFGLLWLRRLGLPVGACLLGAATIEAAPFMRHNWELNLTSALAWLPLMLWAADRAMVERRASDGIVLGGSFALCAWVGSPPALWFACSLTLLYGAMRLAMETRQHGLGVLPSAIPTGGLALLVGGGLTAALLAPGLTLAEHSVQAGTSYASISGGGLELSSLRALVSAQPGNHLYVGLIPLALGVLALRRRAALPVFFAAIGAVAVLMSLGDHGPLFGVAFEWVPGVSLFRLPHRYEAWLGPAAGALAAFGVAELAELSVPAERRAHLGRASFLLLAVGVALSFASERASYGLFLLGLAATFFAMRSSARDVHSVAFGGALAMLLLADVSHSLPAERHMRADNPPGDEASATRLLPRVPGTDAAFRYMDEFGMSCRSGTRTRHRDLRGYQDPLSLSTHERVVAALRDHPGLAEQFNVRFAIQGPHFIHGWNRHYLPPPGVLQRRPGTLDRGSGVTELTRAMPFAYWVPARSVERVSGREQALARTIAHAPAPMAILDGAAWPPGAVVSGSEAPTPPPGQLVSAVEIGLERDELSFVIDAPEAGIVVVNEAFYPGWHARVDGEPTPVFRANAFVRAIEVDAGRHRVEMRFEPEDGAALRWLLVATPVGCAVVLLVTFMRRKRSGGAVPSAAQPGERDE